MTSTNAKATVSSRAGWWAAVLFTVAAMVSYTDRFILSLLVDPIERELGISDAQFSIIVGAAFAVFYTAMGVAAGWLADRHNRKRMIIFGILIWSIATIATGFARDFESMVILRVAVGTGEAMLMPAAVSMLADMFPPERRSMPLALLMLGMIAGNGFAFLLGGALVELAGHQAFSGLPVLGGLSGWRIVMVIAGTPGIFLAAAIVSIREPMRAVSRPPNSLAEPLAWIWRQRRQLAPIYFGCAALSLGDFALVSWAPSLMIRSYGVSTSSTGFIFGVLAILAGSLSALAGGAAAGRLRATAKGDRRPAAIIAATIVGLAGTGLLLVPSAYGVIGAISVWGFSSAFAQTVSLPLFQERLVDEVRGIGSSLGGVFNIMLGLSIGPVLVPVFKDLGMALAPALLMAMAIAGTAAAALFAMLVLRLPASTAEPRS
ncbi:MFS transporter [Sphingopyxis sp. YF1]|uniref:MFS transporter n=1 Tax=unclassified Sphingopyxis TaxID=2614943 RepID=UPI001F612378|nr:MULTISPECIES: MFS transporter [unclassified Sphingopyxis]UNU44636.1 MFS transporter [Sphingopyxis sp. YF1]USI76625.1 MFS transporter [Sphingopyxis sp. USTB-05]